MNEVTLIGAPMVVEIRIRFALPLLTCEADHWREFLGGVETSDLDSNRIGDLKEEIEAREEEIGAKDEAIGELEKKLGEVRPAVDWLRAALDMSKRSKLYPIVMERVKKIEEILEKEG